MVGVAPPSILQATVALGTRSSIVFVDFDVLSQCVTNLINNINFDKMQISIKKLDGQKEDINVETKPLDIEIIQHIKKDISNSEKPYSSLSNEQIAKELNVSGIKVRDRILKMKRDGIIDTKVFWFDENKKFYSRIIIVK